MEIRGTSTQDMSSNNKRDKSKIYFFLIAISALLLTNVYFFVKFKSSGEKLYTVTLQKEELQREVDRAEAELDNLKSSYSEDFPVLFIEDELAVRETIKDLRFQLDDVNINDQQIQTAKSVIQRLKNRVMEIKDETVELRLQNEILRKENEKLNSKVEEKSYEVQALQSDNLDLNKKVSTASSIKVSSIMMNGVEKNIKDMIYIYKEKI